MSRKYIVKDPSHLEEVVNRELDLRSTKNSGAVHNDGDGKGYSRRNSYDQLLVDCKHTIKAQKSRSFKGGDWSKTVASAVRYGRIPVMAGFFPDEEGGQEGEILVLLPLRDFARLYREIE